MIIHCWDTRVQSYPTSASKIKSINCSAWPFLYFLFTADDWTFCDTFLSPWTKSIFFKILIRYWGTGVQNYLTSACKILGLARKRWVPAKKCCCRSTKKANVFKAKRRIEKGVPATSARCPDYLSRQFLTPPLPFHRATKIPQPNIFTLFIAYMTVCVCVCVCVYDESVWKCVFVYVSECVYKAEACR